VERVLDNWDTARAHVVNHHLKTTDYDVATSILNNHREVVYGKYRPYIWKMWDNIWEYFELKYPLCEMNRFRKDHPSHRYSYDCWFEEARLVFCAGSVEKALEFLEQYPYSGLEIIMISYILENHQTAVLSEKAKARMKDVMIFQRLINSSLECSYTNDDQLYKDLSNYIPRFAPRLSAYLLLLNGSSFFFHQNKSQTAVNLLTQMRPLFPDSSVCYLADYDFQNDKVPEFDSCMACLQPPLKELHYRNLEDWNTDQWKEYSAISWDEGEEVYLSRHGIIDPKQKKKGYFLYRTVKTANGWTEPEEQFTLSMNYTATPQSITADGRQLLLRSRGKLYIALRDNENSPWNVPVYIPLALKGIRRAVFAPDGKALIIEGTNRASTIYAQAHSDLFYSLYDEKYQRFGKPRSLGSDINTSEKESNPYLSMDGETLYFSSEGHNGYGNLDIYVSKRLGGNWDTWSKPRNMGCQVNSLYDDYAYTWVPENGSAAVFTRENLCNRDFDLFEGDIPEVFRPKPFSYIRGQVKNTKGKPISKGYIELTVNKSSKKEIVNVTSDGRYRYRIPDSVWHVSIYPNFKGFYALRDTSYDLRNRSAGTVLRDTFQMLTALEAEKHFELRYARYDDQKINSKEVMLPRELYRLSRFAKTMRAYMTIRAYTDANERNGLAVSEQRAKEIRRQLIEIYGIIPDSIVAEGKGAVDFRCPESPANINCNRRIAIGFRFYKPVSQPKPDRKPDPNPYKEETEVPQPPGPSPQPDYAKGAKDIQGEESDEDEETTGLPGIETKKETPKKKKPIKAFWDKITGKDRRDRRQSAKKEELELQKEPENEN